MAEPPGHGRLSELFTQARGLGSEARAALIDRVRAADDSLARELVALLEADATAETQRTGPPSMGTARARPAERGREGGSARGGRRPRHGLGSESRPAARTEDGLDEDAGGGDKGSAATSASDLGSAATSASDLGSAATSASDLGVAATSASDLGSAPGGAPGSGARGAVRRPAVPTVRERRASGAPPHRLSVPGYRVEGLLGEGGMGAVYAGEQESPARPVAIKVLHAPSGPALARFWTEAEIMARLDHPGIARVLESGESEGHPYIVMERVEGQTLDAYVRETGAPLRARLELFAAICDAVHHAHVNSVVHRDLKPANVMVRPDGRIAVLDFGIARAATLGGESSGRTRAGELIGTPIYMSPEQARLRPDEVDARSDVYSLGVTLYELVCDDLPYEVRDMPLPAVSLIVCDDPPRPLRSRGFDRDLDAIALAALAKDPRDRYQSAAALAADVRSYLDGRAVSVRVPGTLEQLRRFARRRPALAAALAGAAVLSLAFVAIVTRLWLSASAAERVAADARGRAEVALAALGARTADLTLSQARAVVARDPTAALALLAELRASGAAVPAGAWAIDVVADEARGRGAATHALRGHTDEVHWIEPLGGGGLVTASYDGTARVWRPPFTEGQVVFRAAKGRLHTAVPSPDGARIAVGGDSAAVHVVDLRSGAATALPGHGGDVEALRWSPDGAWLVTGDDRGILLAWPRGAPPARRLEAGDSQLEDIVFSADGRALVAGDEKGGVWRWDVASWARAEVAPVGGAAIRALWVSGERLAVAAEDGTVRRWRGQPDALVLESEVATRVPAKRAAFAAGGAVAVIAGVEGTVVRVASGSGSGEILGAHAAKVRGLAVSEDGQRIATGSEDGLIYVWDLPTGRRLALRGHGQRIRHLAFAEGGAVLLSTDGEGAVRRWEPGAVPPTCFEGHGATLEHVAVSADGGAAATSDETGVIFLSDLGTGATRRVGRNAAHVTAIALLGRVAITGDVDGTVAWWRADGTARREASSAVRAIAVAPGAAAPGAATVAVATASGAIALFSSDGAPLGTLSGHPGGTDALAFDPAGGLLASGGQDRAVRVWRTAGGAGARGLVAELSGPEADTSFVRFSPRGDALIAATDDGAVRAWAVRAGAGQADPRAPAIGPAAPGAAIIDPASGRLLAQHTGAVTAVAFDREGRYLATAGRGAGIARIELATGAALVAEARHRGAIGIGVDARGGVLVAREGGTIERWAAPAAPVAIPSNAVTTAAASLPDGRLLVGGIDGSLRVIRGP